MKITGVTPDQLDAIGLPPPPLLKRSRARLAWNSDLAMDEIVKLYRTPQAFFETCEGVREDESVGFFTCTPHQLRVFAHVHRYMWSDIKKGRQSKVTTAIGLGVLLRDCMYLEGMQGILIADTRETAEKIFERLSFAYEHFDPVLRQPFARGSKPAVRHMKFWHGGAIAVLTLGSKAPAVGRSVGRLHISEFGEAQWQKEAARNMFPTVSKRKFAMVIMEGTPGRAGSVDQKIWQASLIGKSRFAPLFLEWYTEKANEESVWGPHLDLLRTLCDRREDELQAWRASAGTEEKEEAVDGEVQEADDLAAAVEAANFGDLPDAIRSEVFASLLNRDERDYFADLPQASLRNVMYRRVEMHTGFAGDPRLFSVGYPKDENDGWIGSLHPVLPVDALQGMWKGAEPDGAFRVGPSGLYEIHPPAPKASHLITADPPDWVQGSGDPGGLAVWRVSDNLLRLVAFWMGQTDPGRMAGRILAAQERYSTRKMFGEVAMIAPESNTSACTQALLDADADGLFWCEREKPGWYASELRNLRAETRGVDLLRKGHVEIGSLTFLQHLMDYDGSQRSKRGRGLDGERHHFELARCFIIAADLMFTVYFPDADENADGEAEQAPDHAARPGIRWDEYDDFRKQEKAAERKVLGADPYATPDGLYDTVIGGIESPW